MAERFQSVWMALLLVSITMMLLQPQQAECGGVLSKFVTQETPFEKDLKKNCQEFLKEQKASVERCDTFWEKFKSAVARKDPKDVKPKHYEDLFKAEPIKIDQDKLLLYTGSILNVAKLLESITDTYVDYFQTIYGIVPKGRFCGKENSDEVFSEDCDSKIPSKMYFAASSAAFAKAASGTVTVLMGGKMGYNKESVFAKYEVPSLKAGTVLRVLMVNEEGVENSCNHPSLNDLRNIMGHERYACKYIQRTVLENESPVDWWNKAKS